MNLLQKAGIFTRPSVIMERENAIKIISFVSVLLSLLIFSGIITGCINDNSKGLLSGEDKKNLPVNEMIETPKNQDKEMEIPRESFVSYSIGESVNGIPLTVTEIGSGKKIGLVIAGALHGNEANTKTLVRGLEEKYLKDPDLVPASVRLYFLAEINPDGVQKKTRKNANKVDLNRNFPTDDWKADAVSPSRILAGSGGSSPGSEPEVRGVTGWLLNRVQKTVEKVYLISFHAAYPPSGSAQPGYMVYGEPEPESEEFAKVISGLSGYKYLKTWVTSLEITGELIHWCEMNNIVSCDIELPDYNSPLLIPKGKNETTSVVFERVLSGLLNTFFIDSMQG
ncbi:MAG: DUF2817 domain-containing protein [Spirochaetales bacterium]|nr:DUF2817 domain-containing protein [Spirochaetales bacterium]